MKLQGNLDLTGRFPYRYESLMRRWREFVVGFVEFEPHSLPSPEAIISDGLALAARRAAANPFGSSSPEASTEFISKWRLRHYPDVGPILKMQSTCPLDRSHEKADSVLKRDYYAILKNIPPQDFRSECFLTCRRKSLTA